MYCLYSLIITLYFLINLPMFIYECIKNKKYKQGLFERIGFISSDKLKKTSGSKIAWFHAVSVGEVVALEILLKKFHEKFSDYKILISTITNTGNERAKKIIEADFVIYFPLDLSIITRKIASKIKPELFVIIETEIWPNIIRSMKELNCKIALANGRISDKSFGGYKKLRFFLKNVLNNFDLLCMQNEEYKERIITMGANPENVKVPGNIKFDLLPEPIKNENMQNIYMNFLIPDNSFILTAASTHYPEEDIVLTIYRELKKKFPELFLVLAPRHPERRGEVEKICKSKNLDYVLRSAVKNRTDRKILNRNQILILDTIGELISIYAISEVVFMGKSLTKPGGGHNILEPVAFSKPVIWGKYMSNFREIENILLKNDAGIKVVDSKELEYQLTRILESKQLRTDLGKKAFDVLQANKGSTDKTLDLISELIQQK
ncbi:3-deoxy-D-manno-octulosonic acid transferase [bacterium]|nr:3-deoxy-D-manno-octulosonic acid transferase [bacterium]